MLGAWALAVLVVAAAASGAANERPRDVITTVAGRGHEGVSGGFGGDGGPARQAVLNQPSEVAVARDGAVLIADWENSRIRRVDARGMITTVAGTAAGDGGDGGPAIEALLDRPMDVEALPDGGFLVADSGNARVRRVLPDGRIMTVAGTGEPGFSGDGGQATAAALNSPVDVAALPTGGFLIVDSSNYRVRRVSAKGVITTVAGTGGPGRGRDGASSLRYPLQAIEAVEPLPRGGFLLVEGVNANVILRVRANGRVYRVAGTGTSGFSGDGGLAIRARFTSPTDVEALADGGYLVSDGINNRVRRISCKGVITTLAGNGKTMYAGDDGPARHASLNRPAGIAVTRGGDVLIADMWNHRIRHVDANLNRRTCR